MKIEDTLSRFGISIRRVVEQCYTVRYTMGDCIDVDGISILLIPEHLISEASDDMKKRSIRLRFISKIIKRNVSYYKELML